MRVSEFIKRGDKSNVISLEYIFHDRWYECHLLSYYNFLVIYLKLLIFYFSMQDTRIQGTFPRYLQNKFRDHINKGSIVNIRGGKKY